MKFIAVFLLHRNSLSLERLTHKPTREVAADVVTDDCPQPTPEHHRLELAEKQCRRVVESVRHAVR